LLHPQLTHQDIVKDAIDVLPSVGFLPSIQAPLRHRASFKKSEVFDKVLVIFFNDNQLNVFNDNLT